MSAESTGLVPGQDWDLNRGLCPKHQGSEVALLAGVLGGRCQGHHIHPAEGRAEELRDKIVDQGTLQSQSAGTTSPC
ncbi:unnamed protein product [Pipistrellus nathusii]|uniref:Uncharacterized protein n=1 Tax=Pipistrellus nathusii TaxID=59473 RepID=A0ABP0A6I7_PIPNA